MMPLPEINAKGVAMQLHVQLHLELQLRSKYRQDCWLLIRVLPLRTTFTSSNYGQARHRFRRNNAEPNHS